MANNWCQYMAPDTVRYISYLVQKDVDRKRIRVKNAEIQLDWFGEERDRRLYAMRMRELAAAERTLAQVKAIPTGTGTFLPDSAEAIVKMDAILDLFDSLSCPDEEGFHGLHDGGHCSGGDCWECWKGAMLERMKFRAREEQKNARNDHP